MAPVGFFVMTDGFWQSLKLYVHVYSYKSDVWGQHNGSTSSHVLCECEYMCGQACTFLRETRKLCYIRVGICCIMFLYIDQVDFFMNFFTTLWLIHKNFLSFAYKVFICALCDSHCKYRSFFVNSINLFTVDVNPMWAVLKNGWQFGAFKKLHRAK